MKRLAFIALAIAGVFWGLGFPLGKLALVETEPSHMILLRFVVAAICALPFALRRREHRALFRSPVVLAAGVLYGVAFLVQFEALDRTSIALSALLVGLMPALIALSAPFVGERVSRLSWAGVGAATGGAVLIAGRPDGAGTPLGVALALVALLIFLAWLMVLRRAPRLPDPMALPAAMVVIAALAVAPVALAMNGPPDLDLSIQAWGGIVGQGVLSTLAATAAWQYGASRVGAASAGVFINIEPLMGAAIGVLLFGDPLTVALGVGGAFIIAGSLIVVLGERPPVDAVPPTPA